MKRLLLFCVTVLVLVPASASQTSPWLGNKPRHSGTKSRENSLKVRGVPHASPNIAITKTNTQSSKLADPGQQLNSLERQTIHGQRAQQKKFTAPINPKAASVAEGKNPPLNFEFRSPKNGLQTGPPARGSSKGSGSGLNRRLNGTGR